VEDNMKKKQIQISLKYGVIATPERQKRTALALGLKRRQVPRLIADTPCVRGMLRSIQHLVQVEETPSSYQMFGKIPEYEIKSPSKAR
jgi:large subunit ribosomal protein L30